MANSYYNRIYEYTPRTKAIGQQVKDDFQGTEGGFDKLPAHNENGNGFDETFVVKEPTGPSSPVPRDWMQEWVRTYVKDYVGEQLDPDVPDGGISWTAPLAEGGETVLDPPFKFKLAAVYINGVKQDETRGAYAVRNDQIHLSEALYQGDQVEVVLGKLEPAGEVTGWSVILSDYTAINGDRLLLDSVQEGSFAVTLPEKPQPGWQVEFLDIGDASSSPIDILRNGSKIMGMDDDTQLTTSHLSFSMLFCGVDYGWRILE